jgi:hypothetical protein
MFPIQPYELADSKGAQIYFIELIARHTNENWSDCTKRRSVGVLDKLPKT